MLGNIGWDFDDHKALKGCWAISDGILMIKLRRNQVDINLIYVYASASASTEEDMEAFYSDLNEAAKECTDYECTITMGDFIAKVGS